MGAGKSTLGRHLAQVLDRPFYDSDRVIEEKTGADIPWIFDVEGEDGFQIDAGSFVVELAHPGWISLDLETVLDERDWDPEERDEIIEIEIGPEDAEHDDLVAIFADGSGLFQDTDRDGEITSQERETGWLAGGTAHPKRTTDDADSEAATEPVDGADALGSTAPLETSSGCGGQKGGMSWVFWGPFVLMGLRRQSPRH